MQIKKEKHTRKIYISFCKQQSLLVSVSGNYVSIHNFEYFPSKAMEGCSENLQRYNSVFMTSTVWIIARFLYLNLSMWFWAGLIFYSPCHLLQLNMGQLSSCFLFNNQRHGI